MVRRASLATLDDAAGWLDDAGLALLFPRPDSVLPSLWEAVAGQTEVEWAVRDGAGRFVSFAAEMERVWSWKDELPARRLGCIGLHVVRTTGLVSRELVPAVYALTGRAGTPTDFRDADLQPLERELAEAALELGRPATRRELRLLVGREKRDIDRAVNVLQQRLVLTNAGRDDEGSGWSATLHDLFARRWRVRLRRVPTREAALGRIAGKVLAAAGDLSAADLAAALRLRRREATDVLEGLEARGVAEPRRDDGVAIWLPVGRAASERAE